MADLSDKGGSMKRIIIFVVIGFLISGISFIGGMEFKAYQVRSAISKVISGSGNQEPGIASNEPTIIKPTKAPEQVIIQKAIGDEIQLATINLKVNSVSERQSINSSYGSPKVAGKDAKFVVINLDVTNTTDSVFYFSPDFILIDEKERKYEYYSDMIGNIDNYLMGDVSPSIKKTGNIVYEIPSDSLSYSLLAGKAGTNEVYKITLK